jgi:thiol:disulfide interchange protein
MVLAVMLFSSVKAQEEIPSIEVSATSSRQVYAPGDTVVVALQTEIPSGYHFFDNPMGPGIGKPMTFMVKGSGAIAWLDLLKKKSKKFRPQIGGWIRGFEGSTCFFIRGVVSGHAAPGEYTDSLSIGGLICEDACHPVDKTVPLIITVGGEAVPSRHFKQDQRLSRLFSKTRISQALELAIGIKDTPPEPLSGISLMTSPDPETGSGTRSWNYSQQEAENDFNLLLALLFGFIAGIILNAMPCVLPVLGVKILSFAEGSGTDRKKAVLHSLFFSAGVLSVFLLLAALASFANFSWGQQFQDPRALVGIITLIVIFSLGMFDVYLISVPGSRESRSKKKQTGLLGHLFSGIFATVLATPCSGPFLGAVLAWSVTQPSVIIFVVYASIGAGMSFPYVLLSASKRLSCIIPRPGEWMNDFKKVMGFLLIGFAVYLMLGLPVDLVVPTVLFCVFISLAVVIFSRIAPWGASVLRKMIAVMVMLAIASGGFAVSFLVFYPSFSISQASTLGEKDRIWLDFNADSLLAAHKQGRPAIVDFTANWCMNCQYNYIAVLTRKEITDLIKEKHVLALKADMTSPDPVQDSLLRSLGSRSIPFLAIFPGDKPLKPVVMRDVLTVGKVKRELERLR